MNSIIIVGRTNKEDWLKDEEKSEYNIRELLGISPEVFVKITYIDPEITNNDEVQEINDNTYVIYKASNFEDYIDTIDPRERNLFHYIIYDYSVPLDIRDMNRISELLVPNGKMYIPGLIKFERILSPEEREQILRCGDTIDYNINDHEETEWDLTQDEMKFYKDQFRHEPLIIHNSECIKVFIKTWKNEDRLMEVHPDTTYGDLKAFFRTSPVDQFVMLKSGRNVDDVRLVSLDANYQKEVDGIHMFLKLSKLANILDTSNFLVNEYGSDKLYPIITATTINGITEYTNIKVEPVT